MLPPDFLASCKSIFLGGYFVEVQTKTPIDRESALKGLASIQRLLPELEQSDTSEDGLHFVLSTKSDSPAEIVGVRLNDFKTVGYFWGPEAKSRIDRDNFEFFDRILSEFQLHAANIEEVTESFLFLSFASVNHYDVIQQSVLRHSPLADLFPLGRILDNDVHIRGMIGEKDSVDISITSDVAEEEITKKAFEDDFLQISVYVSRTGPILESQTIAPILKDQLGHVERFIRESLLPNVVIPMDEVLTRLEGAGK